MSTESVKAVSWIAIWVILAALAAVAAVDLWLVRYGGNGPTVSSTVSELAGRYPVIVLAVGVVLGHLFWPQR